MSQNNIESLVELEKFAINYLEMHFRTITDNLNPISMFEIFGVFFDGTFNALSCSESCVGSIDFNN
jgi:hypothetical protein